MQKIMFNDKYGLTDAVLQGRKTMTRRVIKPQYETIKAYNANFETYLLGELDGETFEVKPCYYIGEVVAIAQSYKDAGYSKEWVVQNIKPNPKAKPIDPFEKKYPGWTNKMFVKAEFMPNFIRITANKIERLRDISDDDCMKEGIRLYTTGIPQCKTQVVGEDLEFIPPYGFDDYNHKQFCNFDTPREAFAALIDKVSGRGTWERNPWVFAYSYELVKK